MATAPNTNEVTTKAVEQFFEHHWKIRNFLTVQQSQQSLEEQKIEIDTGIFSSFKSKWQIGLKCASNDIIQICFALLEIQGRPPNIVSKTQIEFLVNDGSWFVGAALAQHDTLLNGEFQMRCNVTCKRDSTYWSTLINTEGYLTIKIKQTFITMIPSPNDNSHIVNQFRKQSVNRMQNNFQLLLENLDSFDVKIICSDGKELGAHKIILSAQNEVFSSLFRSDLSENNSGIININDISGETMKLVLHYLYTGELPPSWCKPETVVEFTYAAGKYQLTEILEMLDNVLGNVDSGNQGLMLLNLAQKLSLKTAEQKLMERIVKLTNSAKTSEDLLKIFGYD